jgi:hypothetical protein
MLDLSARSGVLLAILGFTVFTSVFAVFAVPVTLAVVTPCHCLVINTFNIGSVSQLVDKEALSIELGLPVVCKGHQEQQDRSNDASAKEGIPKALKVVGAFADGKRHYVVHESDFLSGVETKAGERTTGTDWTVEDDEAAAKEGKDHGNKQQPAPHRVS